MPSARSAIVSASVPLPTPTTWGTRRYSANSRSKRSTSGPRTKRPEAATSDIRSTMRAWWRSSDAANRGMPMTSVHPSCDTPGKMDDVTTHDRLAELERRHADEIARANAALAAAQDRSYWLDRWNIDL